MKRYFYSVLRYFLIYIFGFLAFIVFDFAVSLVYGVLCEWMPSLFVRYNFVTEPELADRLAKTLKLAAGVLSVFLLTVLAVKYDNMRYEHLISRTDGFYTLREGAGIYISAFLPADILASVLVPLTTYALIFIRIGEEAPRLLRVLNDYLISFISVPLSFTERFGTVLGAAVLVLVSLASRVAAVYMGLKRWRAIWLSDIGKEGA